MANESALYPDSFSSAPASGNSYAAKARVAGHAPADDVVTKAELLRSARVRAWVPPHLLNEFLR